MRSGRFAEAADRFDELANRAEDLGRPAAAAELALRAARCRLELDDRQGADLRAERALGLFIRARRAERARQVAGALVPALERRGQPERAERLRQEVAAAFGAAALPRGPAHPYRAGQPGGLPSLPVRCPACGGPLKADEVAWADPRTAECPWCGGAVRAEGSS